jgi:hypothetical protein
MVGEGFSGWSNFTLFMFGLLLAGTMYKLFHLSWTALL